jgi:DHA1 family multidrug resistance protein-like MFS transporter
MPAAVTGPAAWHNATCARRPGKAWCLAQPVRRPAQGSGDPHRGLVHGRARVRDRQAPHQRASVVQPPIRILAALAPALRSRAYRAAASANLADGFAALGVRGAIVPLFVRDVLHRSPVWTGIGFLIFAAMNGVALLPAGRAADTLGRRPVIVTGCAISAGGMAMLAVLPGLGACLAALGVAGLGSGLLDVAPSAMIGDMLDSHGGTLVASYQMAGDIGAVVGPVAAGFLVDTVSYPAAFALGAVVLGVAAVLGFCSPETAAPSATPT